MSYHCYMCHWSCTQMPLWLDVLHPISSYYLPLYLCWLNSLALCLCCSGILQSITSVWEGPQSGRAVAGEKVTRSTWLWWLHYMTALQSCDSEDHHHGKWPVGAYRPPLQESVNTFKKITTQIQGISIQTKKCLGVASACPATMTPLFNDLVL